MPKNDNDIINLQRQAEDSGYSTARDYTTTRYHEEKKDASNMSKEMNICHFYDNARAQSFNYHTV